MLGSNSAPKMEWPELVGLTQEEAERKIKENMPRVQIQVVGAILLSPWISTKDGFDYILTL